jgi:alkanesulfonate monooxygenase SsuD/methylene tetrahydromethanopterin reductase-like flavin-dependent oxidoreductase (luciferase family)
MSLGRDPSGIRIVQGLVVILGESREEARRKLLERFVRAARQAVRRSEGTTGFCLVQPRRLPGR